MYNKNGWSFLFDDGIPVVNYFDELMYNIKRFFIDIISIIPFISILIFLFIIKKFEGKKKDKILLGTVPIIAFELLNKMLIKHGIDNTLFVFKDWSNGNFHNGITFQDICSSKFLNKNPYGFGSYISFIWALKNFNIFILYFNSGFLERTIFWKIEPIIYQIFQKKIFLNAYGSDTISIKMNSNRIQKIGHMLSSKKYFLLDNKRESRIYHWSKYVNFIIATQNYMDYLPRIDILTYCAHIFDDISVYKYNFNKQDKIKIIHYANDRYRKGSDYIENILKNSNYNIDVSFFYGESRDKILKELNDSHFFIEQLTEYSFSFSGIEAMLKGKILFTYIDEDIDEIYKIYNSEYYVDFIKKSPIVSVNINNIDSKINEYLNKDFKELEQISLNTKKYAEEILLNNEKMFLYVLNNLIIDKK